MACSIVGIHLRLVAAAHRRQVAAALRRQVVAAALRRQLLLLLFVDRLLLLGAWEGLNEIGNGIQMDEAWV